MAEMKLYYEALKLLPEEFIHDDTKACIMTKDLVVAVNPNFAPMAYRSEAGKWEPIEFDENAFGHMETCDHGQGLTEYCEPCGRVNGEGS